jgi:hypothetical protein
MIEIYKKVKTLIQNFRDFTPMNRWIIDIINFFLIFNKIYQRIEGAAGILQSHCN